MQFNFDYKDNIDSNATNERVILTPGKATFYIKAYQDRDKFGNQLLTKAGDPKLRVDLIATDIEGAQTTIYEHITAKTGWKLGQILKAIGKKSLYTKDGSLDPRHLLSGTGECTVKTQNDPGYPMTTVVDKYIPSETDAVIEEFESVFTGHEAAGFGDDKDTDGFEDDSLPF